MKLKLKLYPWGLLTLFFITRFYIWIFNPKDFSEIIYSYMPFAHLWASGVKPYLEQWYEYPPATIPLFYLPHLIDMASLHQWWHLSYQNAYRFMMLLIDSSLFAIIWATLNKQKAKFKAKRNALLFYILITTVSNHFIYDTMDLAFAAGLMISVVAPFFFTQPNQGLVRWLGYFLATALKYINAPLAIPYFLAEQRQRFFLSKILMAGLAFIIIWGAPLVIFRSSLQVSLVYHQLRGIQVDSTPAIIIRTIDLFTHSEKIVEVYKNYDLQGPVTNIVKTPANIFFIAALTLFIGWTSWQVIKSKQPVAKSYYLVITVGYLLVFLLTGKVLSRPFLIWLMPILAIYPFNSSRQQLQWFFVTLLMTVTTYARAPNLNLWLMPIPLFVGWIRVSCLVILLWWWGVDYKQSKV